MKLPEKYLEKYNLLQACLYIAFGYKTMTEEAESLHRELNNRIPPLCHGNVPEYKKYITAASNLLTIALKEGKINATDSSNHITISEQSSVTMSVVDNPGGMICDNKKYSNVIIATEQIHNVFSNPLFPHHSIYTCDYMSPYMVILFEIVAEEHITETHQGKAVALSEKIKEKMKARGLNVSQNIANAMATIIRMPSSQRGKGNI